jgi:tetratricopeptide (TPR) repeat protein
MEAMAIGCQIVTTDLGALAETTAGFATLIPSEIDRASYKAQFIAATIDHLTADANRKEIHLRQQVDYANTAYIWTTRAAEWLEWLRSLVDPQAGSLACSAHDALIAGEYDRAIEYYRQAIDAEPIGSASTAPLHWDLGLALLLNDQSEAAQEVWMLALLSSPEPMERSLSHLSQILQSEQQRQRILGQSHWVARIQDCLQQLEANQ